MKKAIYGLIGYPVKHSLSGVMHNAAFKALGINAEYRLFEVDPGSLEDFLLNPSYKIRDTSGEIIYAKDVKGFNITIPHKVRAREILSKSGSFNSSDNSYYVELSGAVNTVKRNNGGGMYWNTDSYGFEYALRNVLKFNPQSGGNVFIAGCGGVGRVIISVLSRKDLGINKIYIYDKSRDAEASAKKHFLGYSFKYPHIKEKLEFISEDKISDAVSQCRLLVNASPAGMNNDECPIPEDLLHKNLFVYDVVYNRETKLIKTAREKCFASAGGLSMLLYQGAYALSLWTNKDAPVSVMKDALEKEAGKKVE